MVVTEDSLHLPHPGIYITPWNRRAELGCVHSSGWDLGYAQVLLPRLCLFAYEQRVFGEKCSGAVLQNPNYTSLNVCGAAHRSNADWLMNVPEQRRD